jgi:putative DNA primase/helicase
MRSKKEGLPVEESAPKPQETAELKVAAATKGRKKTFHTECEPVGNDAPNPPPGTKHFLTPEQIEEDNRRYLERRKREDAQLKALDERTFTEEEQKANLAIANAIRESIAWEQQKTGSRARPQSRRTTRKDPRQKEDQGEVTTSWPTIQQRPCFGVYTEVQHIGDKVHKPGVYWHDLVKKDTKTQEIDDWICAPLIVSATTANRDDSEYGRLLEFTSGTGKAKKWSMPMRLLANRDGLELKERLLDEGLAISHAQLKMVPRYIADSSPPIFLACASHTGWHTPETFVLPDEVIGKNGVWFQSAQRIDFYRKGGDFDTWKNKVALPARGNPNLIFAISYCLCGPLLKILNLPGAGVHLFGDSTIGKTTALICGSSVWGGEAYKKEWRATANGLEGAAAQHSDTLLVLDEIKEIPSYELDEVAYFLINGQGKTRANVCGEARPAQTWRVAVFSAGEPSVQARLADAGISIKDGQALRILDVPVIGKAGLFDDLHGVDNAAFFADALVRDASTHYGHAGPAFVQAIIGRPAAEFGVDLQMILAEFGALEPQLQRGARVFALAALAGELAIEEGILPWTGREAIEAAKTVFAHWREARAVNAPGTTYRKVLEAVSAFIDENGESRFSAKDPGIDQPIIHRTGPWRTANGMFTWPNNPRFRTIPPQCIAHHCVTPSVVRHHLRIFQPR